MSISLSKLVFEFACSAEASFLRYSVCRPAEHFSPNIDCHCSTRQETLVWSAFMKLYLLTPAENGRVSPKAGIL